MALERDLRTRALYRTLAAPPGAAVPGDDTIEVQSFVPRHHDALPKRAYWAWCHLGADAPMTYVPLPGTVHTMLCAASEEVVRRLPPDQATPLELVTLQALQPGLPLHENVRRRPDCFIAPHGRTATGESWLNLSAVEPDLPRLCGTFIDRVIGGCGGAVDLHAKSLPVARSDSLATIVGRDCILHALEQLLRRGYKQGLEALLRAHLRLATTGAEAWWVPAIEFRTRPGSVDLVRVAWLRVRPPKLRRIVEIPPAPPAGSAIRQRRKRRMVRGRPARRKAR